MTTKGSSGIGAALVAELVDRGAEVWIADRRIGPAQKLADRLSRGDGTLERLRDMESA